MKRKGRSMKVRSIYSFIFLSIITCLVLPIKVDAKTLKQFENEMNSYIASLQEKKNKVSMNNEEINKIKNNISSLETKVSKFEKDITKLKKKKE